ncbi:tryptophan synthase subunit beta [Brachyspira hyodysenteriae]|uniref:Tryptophan synthase beta chain n=1 Tax=Brachyspira hyodysenteriae (strain ATCC 49526 / WA1) TaxID=565034 RepID=A0A3B6V8U1_BRAHW|nr:tryptophan synthase subunit beta [Brachyspira hyodysenteriae]ACN83265.1 tryptophan synthase beta subunit [Brachyspira hyodysenteriae WA1]AUJ49006.1 tryptophan synthase subunit beta [Brachyspira hyodysenteriae]KLI15826.1 tryptophan synthase subunit beta [Brachyspira hyodysenteriae]KLI25478.1 tryptophan synthase subunit beta [Brachyspira hyodysenteriae]KLI27062.1 tryptophan synthase subunit beta [Brachyspira hyodysenteriae]
MKNSNKGFFGKFGGRFVPEALEKLLIELEEAFLHYINDKEFLSELEELRADFIGRPTPLMYAKNLSEKIGGAKIYVKLEGLAHTGAHKINNSIGQALLAKKMGKKKIIAETGAGQHGLATAAACAKLGLECSIYMGEIDVKRQQPNVASMELYGANVVSVTKGGRGLKDAVDMALEDWVKDLKDTHYLLGSAVGPSPYPDIVRTFQSVIGRELDKQIQEKNLNVKALIACVGGGSNAIGFFEPFIERENPKLIAVEAGGISMNLGENAIRMQNPYAKDVAAQGYMSKFILKENGEISETMSISAGLDYPGVGPQLAYLGESGRIEFTYATDKEAINAVKEFASHEGVIFALESAHAGAKAIEYAKQYSKDDVIIVNMSGRGDKDIFITSPIFRPNKWKEFLKSELERLEKNIDIHKF